MSAQVPPGIPEHVIPEHEVDDPKRSWVYWVAIGMLIVLTLIAVLMFSTARSTAQAEEKADELIAALEAAGARATPSREQIVRVLGDGGGAVCQDPSSALSRAILFAMLTNGAGGPGQRPIIADSRVVQGQLLIIETYCPDELEDFQEMVDDLELGDVIG